MTKKNTSKPSTKKNNKPAATEPETTVTETTQEDTNEASILEASADTSEREDGNSAEDSGASEPEVSAEGSEDSSEDAAGAAPAPAGTPEVAAAGRKKRGATVKIDASKFPSDYIPNHETLKANPEHPLGGFIRRLQGRVEALEKVGTVITKKLLATEFFGDERLEDLIGQFQTLGHLKGGAGVGVASLNYVAAGKGGSGPVRSVSMVVPTDEQVSAIDARIKATMSSNVRSPSSTLIGQLCRTLDAPLFANVTDVANLVSTAVSTRLAHLTYFKTGISKTKPEKLEERKAEVQRFSAKSEPEVAAEDEQVAAE